MWSVYTPSKWQERALANIFPTTLEAIKKGQLGVDFSVLQTLPAANKP